MFLKDLSIGILAQEEGSDCSNDCGPWFALLRASPLHFLGNVGILVVVVRPGCNVTSAHKWLV